MTEFSSQKPSDKPLFRPNLTTQQWVDAYTVYLDSIAEAVDNPRLIHLLQDACKELDDRAQASQNFMDYQLAQEQRRIFEISGLGKFSNEAYTQTLQAWRNVAHALLLHGYDLAEDIEFEQLSPFRWKIHQKAHGDHLQWECSDFEATVLFAFLSFVFSLSCTESPISYVRRTLQKQGITKENWSLHAHRLMIRNPWEESYAN